MNWDVLATGVISISAVAVGGWLTSRVQRRETALENERQWRDKRLACYVEFVSAYRSFLAYALSPDAEILALPHPHRVGEQMPFFSESGRAYKESLEARKTAVFMVCVSEDTKRTAQRLTNSVRNLAAMRATTANSELPPLEFEKLWQCERNFIGAARVELGLHALIE
jgi:hypothetical protein